MTRSITSAARAPLLGDPTAVIALPEQRAGEFPGDLFLQLHDCVDQPLRPRWASRDVDIDGEHLVDACASALARMWSSRGSSSSASDGLTDAVKVGNNRHLRPGDKRGAECSVPPRPPQRRLGIKLTESVDTWASTSRGGPADHSARGGATVVDEPHRHPRSPTRDGELEVRGQVDGMAILEDPLQSLGRQRVGAIRTHG
jgi:hypothetical protein